MLLPESKQGQWQQRIDRARKLSADYPFAADLLRFYEHVAGAQKHIYSRVLATTGGERARRPAGTLRQELDLTLLLPEMRGFLGVVERYAPAPLAAAARELSARGAQGWMQVLSGWWAEPSAPDVADVSAGPTPPATLGEQFCARAFLGPYAEFLAEHTELPVLEKTPDVCPLCGAKPQLGVLRPEGDGTGRSLVCSLCATEWRYGRILCPACGEGSETNLAVYVTKELPQVRVEACETCRAYLKTVDLSKDGHAVPLVDELAAIPLDLWAHEKGYSKLQRNLLGM
jgi:FdhE protein